MWFGQAKAVAAKERRTAAAAERRAAVAATKAAAGEPAPVEPAPAPALADSAGCAAGGGEEMPEGWRGLSNLERLKWKREHVAVRLATHRRTPVRGGG